MTAVFSRKIPVNNIVEAAIAIESLLTDAGWVNEQGGPYGLPLVMRSSRAVNGVYVYLRFTNPNGDTLAMYGDRYGDGEYLSSRKDWVLSPGSFFWGAADQDACCVYLKPPTENGRAYHAGRLDLVEPTDGWGWAVGELFSGWYPGVYEVAQTWDGSLTWKEALIWHGIYANVFTSNNGLGTALLNTVTGRPQLAPYFRLEAEGVFRGTVRFAVSGLAGAPAGSEWAGEDGKIYVATGTGGFRIN